MSLMLCSLASCEDAYHPKIDTVEGRLVVQGLITNDPNQNYILLTKTTSFYDKTPSETVSGATVNLVDGNGTIIQGKESSQGNFHFDTVPVTGQDYKLRILLDKDIYESEPVIMPPLPSVTNFYSERFEKSEYQTDAYGVPYSVKVIGRELYIDAPITPALSNFRFGMRSVMQWYYQPPMLGPPPPFVPPIYGWLSLFPKYNYNVAGPKKFSESDIIEKHPLFFLPYSTSLLIKPDSTFLGWIFILDQYGTSQGSFDYHEKLNSQFSADGTLFDPIQTQVYGNIKCITDPLKIAFGYFDLNSYRQYRYYLYFTNPSPGGSITTREITRYPYISEEGVTVEYPPDWWE